MGAKKYIVDLSNEDRETLESFISTGERNSRSNTRARILLKADDGLTDERSVSTSAVIHKPPTTRAQTTLTEGSRRYNDRDAI